MPLLADSLRSLQASLTIFAVVVAGLVLGKEILIPMALATIFAFILAPLIRRMTQWHVPHALAASVVFVGAIAGIVGGSVVISAQLLELAASLSSYRTNIVEKVRSVSGGARETGIITRATQAVEHLEEAVRREISGRDAPEAPAAGKTALPAPAIDRPPTPGASVGPRAQDGGSAEAQKTTPPPQAAPAGSPAAADHGFMSSVERWLSPIGQTALTLLFTVFLLFQYQDLRDRLVRIAGVDNLSGTTAAMTDAGQRLSRMFLVQAAMSAGYGIVITLALLLIGVPNAVLWGVLAGLMRFVPFVGVFIAAVPPVLLAAGVDPGWTMVIATLVLYAVGEFTMGNIVEPLVLGKQGGISPFAMVVAASFWTLVWGPAGLLLAAPLTLVLVVLGRYVPGLEFFSVMLGDEAALSPEEEFYGRLLTRDSVAATEQVTEIAEASSLIHAADEVVLPGLGLAAFDQRRGRLVGERMQHIRETMSEVAIVAEAEEEAADTGARIDGDRGDKERPRALFVPARGDVDALANLFAARALQATSDWDIASVHNSSGLTALSSRAGLERDARIDALVIVTVGGIDRRHLDILSKRAVQGFPGTRVIVLDPIDQDIRQDVRPMSGKTREENEAVARRRSLAEVAELLTFASKDLPAEQARGAREAPGESKAGKNAGGTGEEEIQAAE